MPAVTTKVGHTLAKVLGIKLQYRNEMNIDPLTRGESVFSISTADTYLEQEPTTWEWIRETLPTGHGFLRYLYSLFPFVHWIGSYNLQWFAGDMIAGRFFIVEWTGEWMEQKADERTARHYRWCCGGTAIDGLCGPG